MINKKTLLALATMLISASAKPIKVKTLIDTLKMVRGHMATVQPTGNLARYEDEEISVCIADENGLGSDDLCCVAGLPDPTQVASFDISQPPRTMIPIVHLPGAGPAPAAFSSCKQVFTQEELEKFPLAPGYVLFSESGNPKMFLHSYVVVRHLKSISANLGLAKINLEQATGVYPAHCSTDACPWTLAQQLAAQINGVLSKLQQEPDQNREIFLQPDGAIQGISNQLNSLQEKIDQLLNEAQGYQSDPTSPLFIPPAPLAEAAAPPAASSSSDAYQTEPTPRGWRESTPEKSHGRYACASNSPGRFFSTPGKRSRASSMSVDPSSPGGAPYSPGVLPLCDQAEHLGKKIKQKALVEGQDPAAPAFSVGTPGQTDGRRTRRMLLDKQPKANSIEGPNLDESGVLASAAPRALDPDYSQRPLDDSWTGLPEQVALATLSSLPPLDSQEIKGFPGMDSSVGTLNCKDQSRSMAAAPAEQNLFDQDEEPLARGLSAFSETSQQPQAAPFRFHPDHEASLGLTREAQAPPASPRTSLSSQSTDSSRSQELLTDSDDEF